MTLLRRILPAVLTILGTTLPAAAQTATNANGAMGNDSMFIWIWAWILVAGIIIFIVGTSLGVRGNR